MVDDLEKELGLCYDRFGEIINCFDASECYNRLGNKIDCPKDDANTDTPSDSCEVNKNTYEIKVEPYSITCVKPDIPVIEPKTSKSINELVSKDVYSIFRLYDGDDNLIESKILEPNELLSFTSVTEQNINIDVEKHLNSINYNVGSYRYEYTFYNKIYNNLSFYLSNISSSSKEIEFKSIGKETLPNLLTNLDSYKLYTIFYNSLQENVVINYLYDKVGYIKYLNELLNEKEFAEFGLFIKLSETVSDNIILRDNEVEQDNLNYLSAPDFNNTVANSEEVEYLALTDLLADVDTDKTISEYTTKLLLAKDLEIDYSDYNNFVHFSSIVDRIERYQYKLTILEEYGVISTEWKDIYNSLDGYEKYLYDNQNITSSNDSFFDDLSDAESYDELNKDIFYKLFPSELISDSSNFDFVKFLNVAGKYLDLIYIYIHSINNIFYVTSNPETGIKRSLINFMLDNFGLNIDSYSSTTNLNNFNETL